MKSKQSILSRLESLMNKLKITLSQDGDYLIMQSAAAGCEYVYSLLLKIFNELWLESMSGYGKAKMSELCGESAFDAEKIKACMSTVYDEYEIGDMAAAIKECDENLSVKCDNGKMIISGFSENGITSLLTLYRFIYRYLTPGVVAVLDSASYDFDGLDGFDLDCSSWDKIGLCTFNLCDSIGGE